MGESSTNHIMPLAFSKNRKEANIVIHVKPTPEMVEWCKQNIPNTFVECMGCFRFSSKRDSMLFKMVWL